MQNSAKSYIEEKNGHKKQKTFSIFNLRKSSIPSQLNLSNLQTSVMTNRLQTDFNEENRSILPEIKSTFFSPRGREGVVFPEKRKESFERIKTQVSTSTADYLNSIIDGLKKPKNNNSKDKKVFFSERQNIEISDFGKLDNNYLPASVSNLQQLQNPAKQLVKNPSDIGLLKKLDKQLKSFSEIRGEKAKSAYLNLLENGLDKELMVEICKMVFSDPEPVGTNLKKPKKFETQKLGIKKSKKSRVHQSMGDIRKQQKLASKQARDFRIEVNELASLFLNKDALVIPERYEDVGPGNILNSKNEKNSSLAENQKSSDMEANQDLSTKRRDKGLEIIKLLLSQRSNSMIQKNISNAKKYREFIKKQKTEKLKLHSQRSALALVKSKDIFQRQRQTLISKIETRNEKLVKDQQKKKLQRKLKKIIKGMLSLIYLVKFLYQMQRFILYGKNIFLIFLEKTHHEGSNKQKGNLTIVSRWFQLRKVIQNKRAAENLRRLTGLAMKERVRGKIVHLFEIQNIKKKAMVGIMYVNKKVQVIQTFFMKVIEIRYFEKCILLVAWNCRFLERFSVQGDPFPLAEANRVLRNVFKGYISIMYEGEISAFGNSIKKQKTIQDFIEKEGPKISSYFFFKPNKAGGYFKTLYQKLLASILPLGTQMHCSQFGTNLVKHLDHNTIKSYKLEEKIKNLEIQAKLETLNEIYCKKNGAWIKEINSYFRDVYDTIPEHKKAIDSRRAQ